MAFSEPVDGANKVTALFWWGFTLQRAGIKPLQPFAIRALRRAAKAGLVPAATLLASCLMQRRGTEVDGAECLQWLHFATAKDDPAAFHLLGQCHEKGIGTPRDPYAAEIAYQRGAELGYEPARIDYERLRAEVVKNAYFPSIPKVNLELSSRCNLKCPYCANPALTRDYENMSDELVAKIVDDLVANNLEVIAVHGVGEPLMRHDLEANLSKMRDRGVWRGPLTTNGTLLTLPRMKSLYEAGVRFIYNSLDTFDPDLYKRTRGGIVAKPIANVKAAAKAYPDVVFVVGLMNHKEQIVGPEMEQQFRETYEGLPNVGMQSYTNGRFPGAAEDWEIPPADGTPHVRAEFCASPAAYLTIDAKGRIVLCCADQNSEHVLGDVRERSIQEVWYDPRNQATFRNIGLGVAGCPAVCFKCVLSPNVNQRSLADIEPILYAPMEELEATADGLEAAGDLAKAKRLIDHALTRMPMEPRLRERAKRLEHKTGIKSGNYTEQFWSEVEDLVAQSHESVRESTT
jgi:MoaA/NifB/PqqE/SkfB family radical SAM enzyme